MGLLHLDVESNEENIIIEILLLFYLKSIIILSVV